MRKGLLLFSVIAIAVLAVLMLVPSSDAGTEIRDSGLVYSVTTEDPKTVEVIGYYDVPSDLNIPPSIKYSGEDYRVVSISDTAFVDCTTVGYISIPDTVVSIGYGAFRGCTNLTEFYVPSSSDYYCGDDGSALYYGKPVTGTILHTYPIGHTSTVMLIQYHVHEIAPFAFSGNKYLTTINTSQAIDLTTIGNNAFDGCTKLSRFMTSGESPPLPKGVDSIGELAFKSTAFETFDVPEKLTVIARGLFQGCSSLTTVRFQNDNVTSFGDYSFYGCTNLADITVMRKVSGEMTEVHHTMPVLTETIGTECFAHCSSLEELALPTALRTIGNGAFRYCTSLASAIIPMGTETIGTEAYDHTSLSDRLTLQPGLATIGSFAFRASSVTSVTIPSTVTVLGEGAFCECTSLRTVELGEGLQSISDEMFQSCTSLETVIMADSIEYMGASAFENCASLVMISLPLNLSVMGTSAFSECASLISIEIPGSLKDIPESAFSGCIMLSEVVIETGVQTIGQSAFSGCGKLSVVTVADTVNTIGNRAFLECIMLTHMNTSASLVTVGDFAFSDCPLLQSPDFPVTLKTIGQYAYSDCRSIETVIIPNGTENVHSFAFFRCTSLKHLTINGSSLVMGDHVFAECSGLLDVAFVGGPQVLGDYVFSDCTSLMSVSLPNGMTDIGEYAFSGCVSLASVIFSKSVTTIGQNAFSSCVSIPSLIFMSGLIQINEFAFSSCYSLTSVTFEEEGTDGVRNIMQYAFTDCPQLRTVTFPSTLETIGDMAFRSCVSITSVDLPKSLISLGNASFTGCSSLSAFIVDPENDTYISDNGVVFTKDMTELCQYPMGKKDQGYDIPEGVTSVGIGSFYQSKVRQVTIPSTVTSIGESAFEYCSLLKKIEIPGNVKYIGDSAFATCESAQSLTLSPGIETIGEYAFMLCTDISSIIIPDTVQSIGSSAFSFCYSAMQLKLSSSMNSTPSEAFRYCTGIQSVSIPSSVTQISNRAFEGCTALRSITLPSGLTDIGESAFEGCVSFKSIDIPSSVTDIGPSAFAGCDSVEYFTVQAGNSMYRSEEGVLYDSGLTVLLKYPSGKDASAYSVLSTVQTIGDGAFLNATKLVNVEIPSSVQIIGSRAFKGCSGITSFLLPQSLIDIGEGAFEGCSSVTSYEVRLGGDYSSYDSALYRDGGTVLMKYPAAKISTVCVLPSGVLAIDKDAFRDCRNLQSITVQDGCTAVGDNAFIGCISLQTIALPDSIETIGSNAFEGCRSLKTFTVPASLENISSDTFIRCESLESFSTTDDCLNYRAEGGVLFSDDLTELVLYPAAKEGPYIVASPVRVIDYAAFRDSRITSLTIPATVTEMSLAFDGCDYLTSINVDSANTEYTSVGGVLYDKKITDIIHYPAAKTGEYTLPRTILFLTEEISGSITASSISVETGNPVFVSYNGVLFSHDMTELIRYPALRTASHYDIPAGVEYVRFNAFAGCTELSSVSFPSSVSQDNVMYVMQEMSQSIKDVSVSNDGEFILTDGMMFTADMSALLSVLPSKGEIVLPSSVLTVNSNAIAGDTTCRVIFSEAFANMTPFLSSDPLCYDKKGEIIPLSPMNLSGRTFYCNSTAFMEIILHTISFDPNGGSSAMDDIVAEEGTVITIPGYSGSNSDQNFVGWTDGYRTYHPGDDFTVQKDVTLKAIWEPQSNNMVIIIGVIAGLAAAGIIAFVVIRRRKLTKV